MKDERPKRCICTANDLMPFGDCICGSIKSGESLPPLPETVLSPAGFLNNLGLKNLSEVSVIRKRDSRVMFIAEIIEDYVKLINKHK